MRCLMILFMFWITHTYSQVGDGQIVKDPITIGVANKMVGLPKLTYKINNDSLNTYYVTYNNLEYQHIDDIKTFSFTGGLNDIEKLYTFLKNAFNDNERHSINVGKEKLIVTKTASSLKIKVLHSEETDGWFYLSKKQLDRLFGKK